MFTRSVVACICGGALTGVLVLDGLSVQPVHAKSMAVKKAAKASRTRATFPGVAATPHRARKSQRPAGKKVTVTSAPARPSAQSRTAPRTPARHLGTFAVRAYTHYQRPLNKTATGVVPTVGRTVAVDPRVIPLGSKIHIEGVGERIAEDTGGRIKGKKLDLFLPSVRECLRFGVRRRAVQVAAE